MPNRLAQETSPYLRQHAENPVDWYPWGEYAFRRAREEEEAIHLSVGYAACHWCHVMAHESFENPDVALLMNERFINIKVDRQERVLEKFWEDGLYFTPRDGERLVHRPRAPYDNAWLSGTSTSVFAFLRLHELTSRDRYRDRAEHVFRMHGAAAANNPFGFAHLLAARDFAQRGALDIILAGDKLGAAALVESVHRAYLPARVLAFAEDVPIGEGRHPVDGRPTAYVCRNRTCDAPVTSAKALVERCAA